MSPDESTPPQDPTLAEFGARLLQRRTELGISQEEAASRVGQHWTGYSRAERGLQAPKLHMIVKLARGLETTPGALLDGLPLAGDDEGPPPRR